MEVVVMLKDLVIAAVLYLIVHEGGHFLCALAFKLRPRPQVGKWYIRIGYETPTPDQHRWISTAGFGTGMLVGLALLALLGTPGAWVDKAFLLAYWGVLIAHFIWYPWRMRGRTDNDFNGMDADEDRDS